MRVFDTIEAARAAMRETVATVGNFDGLHRGHLTILERVLERARLSRGDSLLVTFEPHPLAVLAPERAPRMLTTRGQKLALIEAAGIDGVLILPFDRALAKVEAGRFVREYLSEGLRIREVYVGQNFNFGRGRAGNTELLLRSCADLGITAGGVAELLYLGSPISSSRIRRAIQAGEVELARELLGRPYAVEGKVTRGAGRGAGLGFPTANLSTGNELTPQDGVYVTEAVIAGRAHPAVTNIGSRPTFAEGTYAVETHVLDDPGDLYGAALEVRFLARLRQELRFESPRALVEQVGRDVERARDYFVKRGAGGDRG